MKKIINIILILILFFCAYKVVAKIYRYIDDSNKYEKIRIEKMKIDETKINEIETEQVKVDNLYQNFKNKNNDYVGWITVEGTNIDYPVVQGNNNDFYLYNDFTKEKSSSGSIFMDYRNNIKDDSNIIIYGHNMKNKTMFNNLTKFKNQDFFEKNKIITLKSNNEIKRYEIFSVYVTDAKEEYLEYNFANKESYLTYLNKLEVKSLYLNKLDIGEKDKIITLTTCSFEFNDARIMVNGKRLE
ncbi:class B sortase [Clostridium gasigenes]|uniref:class B sortase n=1 Tax=Clostridium gasigenes TaxID=94869 RepID=UPI001C0A9562|nr:class B sortase [Clostridium gasigenes]MBU3136895.1 class B sortase [Clostridium gasigenes]